MGAIRYTNIPMGAIRFSIILLNFFVRLFLFNFFSDYSYGYKVIFKKSIIPMGAIRLVVQSGSFRLIYHLQKKDFWESFSQRLLGKFQPGKTFGKVSARLHKKEDFWKSFSPII